MIRCRLLHGNFEKPEGLNNISHFNLHTNRAKLSVTRAKIVMDLNSNQDYRIMYYHFRESHSGQCFTETNQALYLSGSCSYNLSTKQQCVTGLNATQKTKKSIVEQRCYLLSASRAIPSFPHLNIATSQFFCRFIR